MRRGPCEKVIGFPVTVEKLSGDSRNWHAYTMVEDDRKVSAVSNSESDVLRMLIVATYAVRREIVLKRAKWRCENCGRLASSVGGLQVHHKVFRSHGRCDLADGLEALCADCHGRKHGVRSKRLPAESR